MKYPVSVKQDVTCKSSIKGKRKTRRHMQKQYKSVRKYPKGLEKLTV